MAMALLMMLAVTGPRTSRDTASNDPDWKDRRLL